MLKKPIYFFNSDGAVGAVPLNGLIYYNAKFYIKVGATAGNLVAEITAANITPLAADVLLANLGDVDVTGVTDNDILIYNNTNSEWNVQAGPGEISGLAQLDANSFVEYAQLDSITLSAADNKLATETEINSLTTAEHIGTVSVAGNPATVSFGFAADPADWKLYINGIRMDKTQVSFNVTHDAVIVYDLDVGDEIILETVGPTS